MKLHGNARTLPKSRRLLVDRFEGDWSLTETAELFCASGVRGPRLLGGAFPRPLLGREAAWLSGGALP
jgi:hypothetical protein